jgi:two-component system CheB/CheR fusion protein
MNEHKNNQHIQIIALGASAGGTQALEKFISSVSPETQAVFVVIQHLAPDHKSMMDDLLSRITSISIKVIEQDMQPEPGTIYLNPPKKMVTIVDGVFQLEEKKRESLSFPITTFFESMAIDFEDQCCAIVLSGTGTDGSEGLIKVRNAGGYTIAQNPEQAKFNGMPNSAIDTKMVDQVLPVEEMYSRIQSMIDHQLDGDEIIDEMRINMILDIIKEKANINYKGYKRSTIQRRIARRLKVMGYTTLDDYIAFLRDAPDEAEVLAGEMLIGVTRFPINSSAFKILRERVFPELFERAEKHHDRKLRVWIPACSTGEEAYAMAMLLDDFTLKLNAKFDITLFASDLDERAIKQAVNRFFNTSSTRDIPKEFLSRYFIPQKNGYKIVREIREMIVFSVHNLIQEPPFSNIDLVSCRNLMIYLNAKTQERVISLFRFALRPNGFLMLGDSESVGNRRDYFREIDPSARIYENTHSTTYVDQPTFDKGPSKSYKGKKMNIDDQPGSESILLSTKSLNEALIQQFVPDSVVINKSFNVLHTTGKARRYLSVPLGDMTDNIFDMVPSSWAIPVEVALSKAENKDTAVKLKQLQLEKEVETDDDAFVDVTVSRLILRNVKQTLFMINFFKGDAESETLIDDNIVVESITLTPETTERITSLERELDTSRESLQATIEELESSNEEIQASNEELQSSNEELKSLNEELSTVNSEYEKNVRELSAANNDLKNLLNSTQIAILFLDSSLTIRRFSDSIKQILNIDDRDVGRGLHNFTSRLPLQQYVDKIKRVQEKLIPFETTINDSEDRTYIMRVTPFRTVNDEIKGVVLSFVEISELSLVQRELKLSKDDLHKIRKDYDKQYEMFRLIANNSNDVVGIHEMGGNYTYVSPSSVDVLGYRSEELTGKSPLDFMHSDDLDRIKEEYSDDLSTVETGKPIQYRFKTKWGNYAWLETTMRHITDSTGQPVEMLSSTRNISEKIDRLDELQLLGSIVENAREAIIITNTNFQVEYVNTAFKDMTGFEGREVLGRKPQEFLFGEESDQDTLAMMSDKLAKAEMFEAEVLNYRKSGSTFWNSFTCKPLFKQDGTLRGYFVIQSDVTAEKLEDKNSKLSRVNEQLQEFAYIASHDLKEPVRAIIGVLDLVENSINATGRDAELLSKAAERARRMDIMISSLLQYSRSGKVSEESEDVLLSKNLDIVKENLAESIERSGAEVSLIGDDAKLTVYPTMFLRLLQNLISNSIKYRSEDRSPKIEVSVAESEEYEGSLLKIKDNGIGIPEKFQKEIFKLFKRGSKSVDHDSNGLGLAISKRIAEHHNGEIWVESIEGEGSTFFVQLNL